jgi:hypothetical protein
MKRLCVFFSGKIKKIMLYSKTRSIKKRNLACSVFHGLKNMQVTVKWQISSRDLQVFTESLGGLPFPFPLLFLEL